MCWRLAPDVRYLSVSGIFIPGYSGLAEAQLRSALADVTVIVLSSPEAWDRSRGFSIRMDRSRGHRVPRYHQRNEYIASALCELRGYCGAMS